MQNTNNINDEQNETLLPAAYDKDEMRKKVRIYSSRLRRIEQEKELKKRKRNRIAFMIITILLFIDICYMLLIGLSLYSMYVGA